MGIAEFLDELDKLFPGYGAVADRLRGGVTRRDQDRLGSDDRIHRLSRGDASGTVSVAVHGRRAHFDLPAAWEELPAAELVARNEALGGGIFAQLFRSDCSPTEVYSIACMGADRELARLNPVRWALWSEQHLELQATRMRRVQFGDGVGFLWGHEGAVEGWKLGRPQQQRISVYMAEMWSADPSGLVRITLATPPQRIEDGWVGFSTLIASWAWD